LAGERRFLARREGEEGSRGGAIGKKHARCRDPPLKKVGPLNWGQFLGYRENHIGGERTGARRKVHVTVWRR